MLDDAQAGESFGRSRFLTHGYRMRLFGVITAALLLVGAPGVPGLLTIPAWVGQDLLIDEGYPMVGDLLRILWEGALMPLFFIPQVVFYFDMRSRKEGYDLAVMARNFGIEEGEMMRYRMNPHEGYRPPGYKPTKGRRQPPRIPPQPQVGPQQWQAMPPQPGWIPPPAMPPMPAPRLPQRRPPRGLG
jgi:hypothetical protein